MAIHGCQMMALYSRWLTSVQFWVNMSACFSQYGPHYHYCIDGLYGGWLTAL